MLNVQNSGATCPNQFLESCSWFRKLCWNDQPCMALKIKSPQKTEEALKRWLVLHGGQTISYWLFWLWYINVYGIKYSITVIVGDEICSCYVMKISKASNSKIGCTYNLLSFVKPLNTSGFMKESSLYCRFLSEKCASSFYC